MSTGSTSARAPRLVVDDDVLLADLGQREALLAERDLECDVRRDHVFGDDGVAWP